MQKLEINKKGLINSKDNYNNWFIVIEEDGYGGYLILKMENKEDGKGYDDWVENFEDLADYIKEKEWQINWVE